MSEELHLSCQICLSLFLLDGSPEAEPVAAPCGHVFHRDCVEGLIESRYQPLCTICRAPLPDMTIGLLKVYLNLEESEFDRELQKAVHEATAPEAPDLDVTLAIEECEEKLHALQEEQQYNQQVLSALESQWIAIDKLHDDAKKRANELEGKLHVLTERLAELEGRHD
ncbi:hypothetical protein PYCCODRAFT_1429039 [Trametes coccinea BRFM310]|uniref:RING-type domain-containing protein n=1 Tax=Trametes coccinea (strain BRFM310) TaxID=1353009 RepID=A0A1Y2I7V7_TRAC3|nr:hypothetical protein PYCCODRAFT_1429039 [Trametes coccinea BRFM310]